MGKEVITNKDFYNQFIECLENGENFELENKIVKGNIDFREIYERIKDKKLKGATIEENDKEIIMTINIIICLCKLEFKNKFIFGNPYEASKKTKNDKVKNSKLLRIILNKDVSFEKSKFYGKTDFNHAEFNGKTDFNHAEFIRYAYFRYTKFYGKTDFNRAKFDKTVSFRYAEFNGDANYDHVEFNEKAIFRYVIFNGRIKFDTTTFEKDAYFRYTKFYGKVNFGSSDFKGRADFSKSIFNITNFNDCTFENMAKFRDIYFGLLFFVDCTFKDMAEFRKGRIRFKKYKQYNNLYYVKRHNKQWAELISNTIKYGLAIFNNAQFLNKHSKIKNFQLSKTSFLMTDVREVMLLCDIKKEKILSHILFENKLKESRDNKNKPDESNGIEKTENEDKTYYHILKNKSYLYFNELIEDINYNSVLAEYRNLRLSVEDNITYEEASNLYKMEMEFKKKYSKNNFEKLAIWFYNLVSNCGESVEISVLCICLAIVLLPLGALTYNYHFSHKYECFLFFLPFIILFSNWLINQIVKDKKIKLNMNSKIKNFILLYVPVIFWSALIICYGYYLYTKYPLLIRDTITAFFQLSIDNKHFMKNWEPLIRVISLILLGNLYIALRRRLSRK